MEAVFKEKSYPANYPADALAIIEAMSFSKGKSVHIMGSMSMRSQQYAGDYDLFEEVQTKGSEHQALRDLADRFKDIVKTLMGAKNVYVGDIKSGAIAEWEILNTNAGIVNEKIVNYNAVESNHRIDELEKAKIISGGEAKYARSLIKESMTPEDLIEAKKELKFHIVRWSPQEVIHGSKVLRDKKRYTLEEAFSSPSLTKLDVIGFIENNRFTDFSIIYEFFNKGKALNDFPLNVAQSLKEDVIYYKAHGNHFKVLKRMLAIAKLNKDSDAVNKLIPILNSDLGRLYLIISDVGTLIELLENERKVPMPLVRFQLDQMKARMGNIYNLPDFLSEEHDLIGDINAILKMTNKAQLLSRLHQIKTKMEGILNTNAKAKGGRRGGATRQERALASEMRAKYFLELGRDPSGRVIRPEMFKYLSAIIHDTDPRPIAGDPATNPNLSVITDEPGRPPRNADQKNRIRQLANYILREEKLPGFPINRAEWLGAEPANPDMLPANLKALGANNQPFYFFEEEPVGVWEHFLKTGMASADDKALLPKDATGATLPFPDFQTGTPSDFRAYFGADYDRLTNPAYVPPPPPQSFSEQLGSLAPLAPADPTTADAIEAVKATTAGLPQRVREILKQMDETNAYSLLLRESMGESGERLSRVEQMASDAEASQREIEALQREIEEQRPIVEAQEREAERRAYEASEAGRAEAQARADAERAQLAQEAQARAEAQEAETRARAEQARAVREGVKQAEKEGKAREQEAKAKGQPLEERVNKERLGLITDAKDKAEAVALIGILKQSRKSIKALASAKAELLRKELALAQFKETIEKRKKEGKKSQGKGVEDKLGDLETDVELARGTVRAGEEGVALLEGTEAKLEAILAKYPVPLPKKEAQQKAGLGGLLEGLLGLRSGELSGLAEAISGREETAREETADEIISGLEGVPTTGRPDPTHTDSEVAENLAEIAEDKPKSSQFNIFAKQVAPAIGNGLKNSVIYGIDAWKAKNREASERVAEQFSRNSTKFLFKFLLGFPFNPLFFRFDPKYMEGIADGVVSSRFDEQPTDPDAKNFQAYIREMYKQDLERKRFFQDYRDSFARATDRALLDLQLMTQEGEDLVKKEVKDAIASKTNILKQMDAYHDMFFSGTPETDAENFIKPESANFSTIVGQWLQKVRERLASMNQFERHLFTLSLAYRHMTKEQATDVRTPEQWLDGNITFPGYEGEGRVRGGWIPTNTELVQMPTEEIEQIAEDDAEFNYLMAQQQYLRTGRNKPKEPRKRAPRGNACADTSIRRRKPPPPPPPPPSFTANGKPKSFAQMMKELMGKK